MKLLFLNSNKWLSKLFNWLWPPLIQEQLGEFCEYWNNHCILKQKHKILPMGTSPHHMWLVPDSVCVTSHHCSIHVDMDTVH